jgi:STE24 endopeptidase
VLYDTLIGDLTTDEIVAVLAHEIGHYKMRHTIRIMLAAAAAESGFMLWVLAMFLANPGLACALGGSVPSVHLNLIGFSILYSPLSEVIDFARHYMSRKYEYAADNFAAAYGTGDALIAALKKISSKSLVNLTPHPFVVFWTYSHPTLLERMRNLQNADSALTSADFCPRPN